MVKMALAQPETAAIVLAIPGLLSFIFAKVAEHEMAKDITDAPRLVYDPVKDTSKCHYPSDAALALGIFSITSLLISGVLSLAALYYPYQGRKVSAAILWRSTPLVVFTILSVIAFLCAEAFLVCATILEFYRGDHTVQSGKLAQCPSANTGIFGPAGDLALQATFAFWVSLMLTAKVRSNYFNEDEEDNKGSYAEVTTHPQTHPQPGVHSPDGSESAVLDH